MELTMNRLFEELAGLREEVRKIAKPVEKEIMSVEQTMELLDCSRNTLDRLRDEGNLKAYRMRGRIYYKRSEVMAALEAGAMQSA